MKERICPKCEAERLPNPALATTRQGDTHASVRFQDNRYLSVFVDGVKSTRTLECFGGSDGWVIDSAQGDWEHVRCTACGTHMLDVRRGNVHLDVSHRGWALHLAEPTNAQPLDNAFGAWTGT